MKFLGTRDIVKLAEVREVRLNEDGHVNASGLITKDAENSANIFKADDTHDGKKDTIRKENIAGGNTATDHSGRETDERVIDLENDELNSFLFLQNLLKQ